MMRALLLCLLLVACGGGGETEQDEPTREHIDWPLERSGQPDDYRK